jgi:hypothetical protein
LTSVVDALDFEVKRSVHKHERRMVIGIEDMDEESGALQQAPLEHPSLRKYARAAIVFWEHTDRPTIERELTCAMHLCVWERMHAHASDARIHSKHTCGCIATPKTVGIFTSDLEATVC